MPIRTVKPTSPARRYLTYVTYDEITKTEPEKSLLSPKIRTNGRNNMGRITVRHRGRGHKRMLRIGSALPGRMSACGPDITVSPTFRPCGAMM